MVQAGTKVMDLGDSVQEHVLQPSSAKYVSPEGESLQLLIHALT